MKNFILTTMAVVAATMCLPSCGGSGGNNGLSDEEILADLQAPFSFKAYKYEDQNSFGEKYDIYEFTLNEDGTFTGNIINFQKNALHFNDWYSDTIPYSGKWTTNYRTLGENSQKVYVLHHKDGNESYFPESAEAFWFKKRWSVCDNNNFDYAYDLLEITTDKGTVVRIPESERPPFLPEEPAIFDVTGHLYEQPEPFDTTYNSYGNYAIIMKKISFEEPGVLREITMRKDVYVTDTVGVPGINHDYDDWNQSHDEEYKFKVKGNRVLGSYINTTHHLDGTVEKETHYDKVHKTYHVSENGDTLNCGDHILIRSK